MIIGEGSDGHTATLWSRAPTVDLWLGVCAVQGCDSDQQASSTL